MFSQQQQQQQLQQQQQQQQQTLLNPNIITIDQEYGDYLYQYGFKQGRFADTVVEVTQINKSFSLHAIILARSSIFFGLLQEEKNKMNHQQHHPIKKNKIKYHLTFHDLPSSVTEEVMTTVLSHLYRPMTIQDIMYLFARPRNLLAMLDVADYLDIQSLTSMIYDALRHEWNFETILFWLPYLDQTTSTITPPMDKNENENEKGDEKNKNKKNGNNQKHSTMSASMSFGIHYLTQTLPVQLESFYGDNYMDLAHVYSHLPLGLLEKCIEHDHLCVRDPMQRFEFAKKVIALRESMLEANDGVSVTLRFNDGEVSVKVIRP
ncbi:hypothetical protein BJ944DRAFT_270893 [Cunninghamella echinulata]|nr:hypothetical protein BJ944DRAFT_270893 [Cunninghamella echinulata]